MTKSLLFALLLAGCGGAEATPFLRAKSAGDRAYSAGRFDEAVASYHQAAGATTKQHDREQAMFLEASALERADRTKEAMAAWDALVAAYPSGDHAARAAYQRAMLEIEKGDPNAGWPLLEAMLFRYPTESFGRLALEKVQAHHEELQAGGGLAFLEVAEPKLRRSEIAEDAAYRRAHALADAGRNVEARAAFVACANAHPYPDGTLTDDAWWNASLLDEQMGRPQDAVTDLEKMLEPRETSALGQGSYERPRYSEAAMRLGALYAGPLHDDAKARAAYHRVYTAFPNTIRRPEALWREAILAKKDGDRSATCDVAETLAAKFPESRYAGCASKLCDDVADSAKAPKCRGYLMAELGLAPPEPTTDE